MIKIIFEIKELKNHKRGHSTMIIQEPVKGSESEETDPDIPGKVRFNSSVQPDTSQIDLNLCTNVPSFHQL